MFLACLFLIAISVWFVPVLERARLPILGAIVLVTGTVFGPFFFAINGPLQISIDRLLFLGICVIAFFSLRGSTARIPKLTWSDAIVFFYTAWVLVVAKRGEAPHGTSPVGTWIFYIFFPAMMYAVIRVAKIRDLDLKRLEIGLLVFCIYLAITGFFEARGIYSLVFPRYISNPKVWEFFGRARGPLLNPSANGILLTIGLSLAAVRFLRAERRGRMLYGFAILVMMLGIYSTLTRSVWIGGFLALAIVFWQVTPRWTKVLGLCAMVLLAGFVAAGLKDQLLRMKRDKNLSAAEAEKSVQLRPLLAIIAYEMFKDAPIAGVGLGHYHQVAIPYYSIRSYGMPLEITRGYHQHNVLLSILVNSGLVGFTAFTALLVMWIRSGWRLSKNEQLGHLRRTFGLMIVASIAGYLIGGMFQDVTIMPMINMYLFFFAAMVVNLEQAAEVKLATTKAKRNAERRVTSINAIDDREIGVVGGPLQPLAS